MAILIKPTVERKNSFLQTYLAYQKFGEVNWCGTYADALTDFSGMVHRLTNDSKGIGISLDWVPTSHFWLIHENRVAGTLRLRHRLTPIVAERAGHVGYDIIPSLRGLGLGHEILRLGLKEANKLGIKDVMAICAETNIPSQRILMRHGKIESRRKNGEVIFWLKSQSAE